MKIRKEINKTGVPKTFGALIRLSLQCSDGFTVSLCSAGASITGILCPWPDGSFRNIALSFADPLDYLGNPLYAGATLAPCAGRISEGRLPLRDRIYSLTKNENSCHTLHGGASNASFQNWDLLLEKQDKDTAFAVFGCLLPDGLDGFPGRRSLQVSYTLTEDHCLTLEYEAVSHRDTWFNLSNHTYFNLTGDFTKPALDHFLTIQADRFISNREDFIPESVRPAAGTPFDFRQKKSLAFQLSAYPEDIQIARNQGYNHGFIFNAPKTDPADRSLDRSPLLTCSAPGSPVKLSASSDAPCMVLYSGGYIPQGLRLRDSQLSCPSCALAFEFQDYPDAPGGHGFPYQITAAGEKWRRRIQYRFLPETI